MPRRTLNTFFRMFLVCALGASTLLSALARADDYTDIWWAGPTEDGWGVNLIQSQDFIFATFFVYGPAPAKTPIWYAGNLTRAANGSFTGGLYQTTGTGIGVTWNAGDHTATQVGTATFTPTSATTGSLIYNVNDIIVTKSIVRQTLTPIALGGNYYGTVVITTSGCSDTSRNQGPNPFDWDPAVSQTAGGRLQFDFTLGAGESCTIAGTYVQEGLLFRIPAASYACTSGINTTATIYELRSTSIGLEGRWQAPNIGGGCQEDALFSAVFP